MIARRQLIGIAFLLLSLFPGLSSSALAQDNTSPQKSQSSGQEPQNANLTPIEMAKGKSIALARYWLLKHASEKLGAFPLDSMVGDHDYTAFFPAGRSDRMYLVLVNPYPPLGNEGDYLVLCYQQKAGKVKRVYRIKIERKDRLAAKGKTFQTNAVYGSLLEYITQESEYGEGMEDIKHVTTYSLPKTTSAFVRNDLAAKRDYVQYRYEPVISTLEVWLLSDYRGGQQPEESQIGFYSVGKDEFMKDPFYKKHGLPVAREELPLIGAPNRSTSGAQAR